MFIVPKSSFGSHIIGKIVKRQVCQKGGRPSGGPPICAEFEASPLTGRWYRIVADSSATVIVIHQPFASPGRSRFTATLCCTVLLGGCIVSAGFGGRGGGWDERRTLIITALPSSDNTVHSWRARRRHSVQRLLGTRDRRMDGRSCRPHAVHMARVDFVVASVVSRLARVDSVERHRLHRRRHATHDASRKFAE